MVTLGQLMMLIFKILLGSLSLICQSSYAVHERICKGLESYGLQEIMSTNPSACESLFVKDKGQSLKPDANYLFSLMVPDYSPTGTSRRMVEEEIMDHFKIC
eukprot:Seg7030.3 transcript_id=Seg7030.3/GoldUCD/mRNA.D3Y31 product="hypothetical protein" protein_id=Seg7030.3/GoldUCD/D3Y31